MAEEFKRPDPDQLLRKIQAESGEQERQRGYLKIFVGYIAGVGKTYRMLSEARVLAAKGADVVIALAETHGRQETEALLAGLEVLPRRRIQYGGIMLSELDVDFVLRRRPKYAIVDELAHTNAPGEKHQKRYQDIEELLCVGINVYTALNIQHIESLNDVVYEITGIKVKETVPDTFVSAADKIELLDLTPEELLQRLQEGKVYIPDKARVAVEHFFKPANLLALREVALRYTANRVDDQRLTYQQQFGVTPLIPVGSKLLVSVSSSPSSDYLIRATYRFADELQADWFAVYVESPQIGQLHDRDRLQLERHCRLVEELGGKVVRLSGAKVAVEIAHFAKAKNIARIIVGFSKRSRLQRMLKGSIVEELLHLCEPIQVLVVSGNTQLPQNIPPEPPKPPPAYLKALLISGVSVALTTGLCLLLRPVFELYDILLVYILPILISSSAAGISGGICASLLAVACFNFLFVPPILTFDIYDARFLLTFFNLTFVGVVISVLIGVIKRQNEATRQREKFITSLYDFTKDIFAATDLSDLQQRLIRDIADLFNFDAVLFRPDATKRLQIACESPYASAFTAHEMSIATWVFEHQQPAGLGTKTLAGSKWRYVALKVKQGTLGVLAIRPAKAKPSISYEDEQLLESFMNVAALALANFTR
jgi:two-component system, OmpR family, sensor histidine kinase KdpD